MADTKPTITYNEKGDAVSFVGRAAVDVFAMAAIASGLRMYARTGMKPNRMYTPKNMMAAARRHLGDAAKAVRARDYEQMADLLSAKVQAEKARIADDK